MERADGFENAVNLLPSSYNTKLADIIGYLHNSPIPWIISFRSETFGLSSAAN